MHLPKERHHVVLAMRYEGDIPKKNCSIRVLSLIERPIEILASFFAIPAVNFFVQSDHAIRGADDAVAGRIITSPTDENANGFSQGGSSVTTLQRVGGYYGVGGGR